MKNIFDYTLKSINRHGYKNISIAFIFGVLVWLLSSVIFITNSIKKELIETTSSTPQLLINKQIGGRYFFLNHEDLEPLWEIAGVSYVKGRVWGQYHLQLKNTFITLLGIEPFEEDYNDELTKFAEVFSFENEKTPLAYVSKNMYQLLKLYRSNQDEINFEKSKGGYEKIKINGLFKSESELFSNDVVLMPTQSVRDILGIEDELFTDIIIKVANPSEVSFIAAKIMHEYPNLKVTTKDEIIKDYELLYQFKSGWFLLLFIISFITFAIILYDKASGLRSEERREIGILKAIGWEINHIIYYKLLESSIVCIFAFFIGLNLAIFYVYFLQAPWLKYVFTGYNELKQPFNLIFSLNIQEFALLFFSTVPLYIAASIIPSWKASTHDVSEILR